VTLKQNHNLEQLEFFELGSNALHPQASIPFFGLNSSIALVAADGSIPLG
jgi:hypothetical protein